jgi:hypothetical protein
MLADIGFDVLIEIAEIRQDKSEGFFSKKRGFGVLERRCGDQHLPPVLAVTPPKLTTFFARAAPSCETFVLRAVQTGWHPTAAG